MRASFLALAAVTAASAALVPRPARADNRWRLQTSFDARDEWIRSMPSLSLHSPFDTPSRTLPAGATLPSTGSQQFATLTWDAGATVNDRWMVPLFGIQFGWAAGTSSEVVSSIDGSIVTLHPWSADVATLLLPGFGVRQKVRRWMFEASLRPVASFLWMSAMVASGASSTDLETKGDLFAATAGLRADLEVCRRTDPVQRVCLIVAPALYEFGPLNGGSIGLRWEVGP
ncbi:MAG TPA: hypothetical protein VIF09_21220 [Polyangiaceae bacterium]